jgi:hypothetical protein
MNMLNNKIMKIIALIVGYEIVRWMVVALWYKLINK